ncbi:MAG: endonuclease domain-containing protein [Balneolaceae bacterium]|nr:endonuclease domain-containing protein [Balneolaceae bacterium]
MADNSKNSTPLSGGRGAGGEAENGKKPPKIPLHAGAEPHQFKYARQLRREMTDAEKVLWQHLRARRFLNLKFRRQHPLLEFIVDFYCHELRLVIEADGEYHNEADSKYYDKERTKEFKRYGVTVIRFTNEEIMNDIDGVLKKLKKTVITLKSTSPQTQLHEESGFRSQSSDSTQPSTKATKSTPSPRGEGRGEVEKKGDRA